MINGVWVMISARVWVVASEAFQDMISCKFREDDCMLDWNVCTSLNVPVLYYDMTAAFMYRSIYQG